LHHKISIEAKDVVPQRNTRLVSEGPPQILFSEKRQVGKEDLYQALVNDWWCIRGSIRYHAELYRLQQVHGILQEKEMLSRVYSPQPSKKDLRSKNDRHAKKRSHTSSSLSGYTVDKSDPSGYESQRRHALSDGYDESESIHETNQVQNGGRFDFIPATQQKRLRDFIQPKRRIQPFLFFQACVNFSVWRGAGNVTPV
jgi:hypothetical protein